MGHHRRRHRHDRTRGTRPTDVADSLPGVAIAIALVPPLVVTGLLWEQGNWANGTGSLLLFTTNALAIVLVGGLTFVATGTAPLAGAARTQGRVRTALSSTIALAVMVVAALAFNGQQITTNGFDQTTARQAVAAWIDGDRDVQIERVRIDGSAVVVVIAAPDGDLDSTQLQADLADALGRPVTLDLRQVVQERVVVDG